MCFGVPPSAQVQPRAKLPSDPQHRNSVSKDHGEHRQLQMCMAGTQKKGVIGFPFKPPPKRVSSKNMGLNMGFVGISGHPFRQSFQASHGDTSTMRSAEVLDGSPGTPQGPMFGIFKPVCLLCGYCCRKQRLTLPQRGSQNELFDLRQDVVDECILDSGPMLADLRTMLDRVRGSAAQNR